jgi:lysyl oxidase
MTSEPQTSGRTPHVIAAVLALAALTAIVAVAAQAGRGSTAAGLLPDLDQETPSKLQLTTSGPPGKRSYRLGFRSAVRNVGAGPLVIRGRLWGAAMAADQVIELADGSEEIVPEVGSLEFVRSPDHRHWHYLGFDRYELRRAGSAHAVVRDRKSGFCLGDRYRVTKIRVANAVPEKVYRGRCGLDEPGRAEIVEGISVGYGDAYSAFLEYQDLPLDGLAAGRYVLVHRVNADGKLRELSHANNAASVLLDLRWRRGVPHLRALAYCEGSATCSRSRLARS